VTTIATGLSSVEAAGRLTRDGANELPGDGPRNLFAIAREVLLEPMFLLLLAACGIYFLLGEMRDAAILVGSIVAIVIVTVLQERRTENTLARLRDLSSPRALVVRDGVEKRIAGREVVVGDFIVLHEGDRVPADCDVLSATALSADESIVTGESLPVDKKIFAAAFSGSLITNGFGTALVTATGARTRIGRIGRSLAELKPEITPLYREVRRMVRTVAIAAILFCAIIALVYGITRSDWLGGVLAGITVAMGVIPEEFPVVLTVFLAIGAWRVSRHGVLTRRMPALEAIGAVTVLAVDKTGTLTENRMRVAIIQAEDGLTDLRGDVRELNAAARLLLTTAFAASERQAFDPMERAIHETSAALIPRDMEQFRRATLLREYDLTSDLLAVTHVWHHPGSLAADVAVKGAPETIFDLCGLDAESANRCMNKSLFTRTKDCECSP
jgi:P-type Ca2+ transporter type 2C